MTAALSAPARALLVWLQGVNAMGEGSLKSWGSRRRPQLTLTQVEVRAAELVEANLVTREVKADGRAVYRARERSPEPPPVEVVTEPESEWIPNCIPTEPFYGVDRSPEPKKKARKAPPGEVTTEPADLTTLHAWGQELLAHLQELTGLTSTDLHIWGADHTPPLTPDQTEELANELVKSKKVTVEVKPGGRRRTGLVVYRAVPVVAPCAECTRMAEALLSWERLWGRDGTDLMAMEARVQEAEARAEERRLDRDLKRLEIDGLHEELAEALGADTEEGWPELIARVRSLAQATPTPAEPALSALARLPVEQRRLVGLALQELSLEALGGALGAARAEAFAARPDLAPRLSANAAAVLEILHPDRGQTPREIGKKAGINQHSVHSALRSLEKRGLATNATYGFWRRAKP